MFNYSYMTIEKATEIVATLNADTEDSDTYKVYGEGKRAYIVAFDESGEEIGAL